MTIRSKTMLTAALLILTAPTLAVAQDSFGVAKPRPVQPPPAPQPVPQPVPPPGTPSQQPSGDGPAPGAPEQPAPDRTGKLDRLAQMERQDFGVPPTQQLHAGPMHGPTPAAIPGGQVLTTKGLVDLQSRQVPYLLFDVLGGPETLPSAAQAAWLAEPGTFDDRVQQQLVPALQQATNGRKDVVLVFYCQSNQCWMSYNAALRAIAAGYTNVLWYRGGIEAWKAAGLPTQPGYRSP